MNMEATAPIYRGNLQQDCAAAMEDWPEVTINSPGHEYHGRTARYVRNLIGDQKALLHVYDEVYVALPCSCVIVTPVVEAAPCL